MIRVARSGLGEIGAGAVMRSVGSDLESCTSAGQTLGALAGEEVLTRLRAFGDLPVGGAVVTPAGGLASDLLIHVVIRSGEEPISARTVTMAFRNGLRQAAEWGVGVLAVHPLGVGAGNLDAEASARIMCSVAREHVGSASFPSEIVILASSAYEANAFTHAAAREFGVGTA